MAGLDPAIHALQRGAVPRGWPWQARPWRM